MAAAAETLEKQKSQEHQSKSFDVLASVRLMQFDIEQFGHVLPETHQRIHDEELTLIAEGIDRPLYSAFTLQEHDNELVYFDKGEWKPYIGTLLAGMETAGKEARLDTRKVFLHHRTLEDVSKGFQMRGLQPGETMVWDSPFPERECQWYGDEFIAQQGFQPKRRMGFVYRAQKLEDGSVTIESHSLDNSDPDAFAAIRELYAAHPNIDMQAIVAEYDRTMSQKYEQEYHAGRVGIADPEEACSFIEQHSDVLDYYLGQIEQLARDTELNPTDLERQKKKLTYGTWALIKELLDAKNYTSVTTYTTTTTEMPEALIGQRINQAYINASLRNEQMIGCGGSINGDSLTDMSPEEAFNSIFGNQTSTELLPDKFGPRTFKCPKGHKNERPHNELIDCCKTCGVSVKC